MESGIDLDSIDYAIMTSPYKVHLLREVDRYNQMIVE